MGTRDGNSGPRAPLARGTLCGEANFDRPSPRGDFEAMVKRRYQDPEPEIVGNWWEIRVYRDEYANGRRIRKRTRIRLAPAVMPVREVQKIKAEYLRPINHGLISAGSATPFDSFVKTVYLMTELPLMASSTQARYSGILNRYLIPTLSNFEE
jgi:hypothetical protein